MIESNVEHGDWVARVQGTLYQFVPVLRFSLIFGTLCTGCLEQDQVPNVARVPRYPGTKKAGEVC
jgi:hypothetical protein